MGNSDILKTSHDSGPESEPADAETVGGGWRVVGVKSRVDSFNQGALMEEIRGLAAQGAKHIALDLKANRFMSLPVIKCCVEVAQLLSECGGGFALVGCSEKTKRHFEIYGTLDHIEVVRSSAQLAPVVAGKQPAGRS